MKDCGICSGECSSDLWFQRKLSYDYISDKPEVKHKKKKREKKTDLNCSLILVKRDLTSLKIYINI